jgi:hypothetical protein
VFRFGRRPNVVSGPPDLLRYVPRRVARGVLPSGRLPLPRRMLTATGRAQLTQEQPAA